MSDLTSINACLTDTYGKTLDNRPKWRVVLGSECLEKRLGTFRDYTEGGIFLREVTEVREVKKYPAWQTYHILERVVPFFKFNEIVVGDGYECFFRFAHAKTDAPLPANWRFINLICHWAETGSFSKKKTPSDLTDEERKQEEEEMAYFHQVLHGNETELGDSLAAREGVSFSGLDGRNSPASAEKVE
jgi:hypothetical protein